MYVKYCSWTGLSKPYAARTCAIRSGVERSPRRAVSGPPGRARTNRKTRIESPKRIGISRSRRRTANFSTERSSGLARHRDLGEVLDAHRTGHVALDALGE